MTDAVIKCDSVYKIFGANAKKILQDANGNVDAFLDATENMLDVMENDVIPAAEEMASAMKAMEESDLDPSSFSESQMKRIEEIEKKGESLDRKMQNMDIDLPF